MMQAVIYGAGNIGRGFIGQLLSESGYEVTFIDIDAKVIGLLNDRNEYPIRFLSNGNYSETIIKNVSGVNGNDKEAVIQKIAMADIMATAVGANALPCIVPNLAAGLRMRFQSSDKPLNIIICENLIDADRLLGEMIKNELDNHEVNVFRDRVGLIEASIGRMVPVQTEEMKQGDPLRICVESYGFLPVDRDAFKGGIANIKNMIPFQPFDFYIKRKLYIHNMGHAICAYLGQYANIEYIYESINDTDILIIVENAMLESALALSKKYNVDIQSIIKHIQSLLFRFNNLELKDTCKRVGNDTKRKLLPSDRLIGAASLCNEQDVSPVYICAGIACAVYQHLNSLNMPHTEANAIKVLLDISGIAQDHPLSAYILPFYNCLIRAEAIKDLRKMAELVRSKLLQEIV